MLQPVLMVCLSGFTLCGQKSAEIRVMSKSTKGRIRLLSTISVSLSVKNLILKVDAHSLFI